MRIKIKETAKDRHRYPDWPWYLGHFEKPNDVFKPKYIPSRFEAMEFEVYENDYWPNKWTLTDKEWAFNNLGSGNAWIDKKDAEIVQGGQSA